MGRTRQPPLRLEAADRLRFCSLWNVPQDISSVRWEQLTTLALYNEAPTNAASILPLAANLRCCALLFSANSSHDGIAIRHPRIETLVLLHYGERDLDALTLPALRHLELSGFSFPSNTADSLSAFVARSRCRLRHLRLVCNDAVPRLVVDTCRRAVPHTSVLTVRREDHRQDEDGWNTEEYWTVR
uniref:F-box domain-containing protein n=1 Tax=Mycena chlorophos TaxID=658473 RepID=A0ABQ0LHU8_MYCCL|nr:predicted protein [Mycena chlorophos]